MKLRLVSTKPDVAPRLLENIQSFVTVGSTVKVFLDPGGSPIDHEDFKVSDGEITEDLTPSNGLVKCKLTIGSLKVMIEKDTDGVSDNPCQGLELTDLCIETEYPADACGAIIANMKEVLNL